MNKLITNEEKDKDVLLFLHGWGCDGSIFKGILPRFKEQFRCIVVDFRGFGYNVDPPAEGWTIEDYARDIVQSLNKEGVSEVTIVAHSFGCRVATVIAATNPQLVKAMLFTGAAGFRRFSFRKWLKIRLYKLKKWCCRVGILHPRHLKNSGSEDYRNARPALKNTFVKVVNSDVSRYAVDVRCPLLVTVGDKDDVTPLWMARRYCKLVKDSVLVVLKGDHFAFLTDVRFSEIAYQFVRGTR